MMTRVVKRDRTLRQRLIRGFALAALIPVLIFALFSQINFWMGMRENVEQQIESNLLSSNQCFDMTMDKYRTLLYDFCTDEGVIMVLDGIESQGMLSDEDKAAIRRQMSHICNSNSGIEGVTVRLPDGTILFYDRLNISSVDSTWAGAVDVPEYGEGEICQGLTVPVETNGQEIYLFQISRDFIDERDINRNLGTVVFSINEKIIQEALSAGINTESYLLDGETVISASDTSLIGKDLSEVSDNKNYRYTGAENEMTGFTILNVQPLSVYHQMLDKQLLLLILVSIAAISIMVLLIYRLTRPYSRVVEECLTVMTNVENGDFSVKIREDEKMPEEIQKIERGFNEMLSHIDTLMEQVKQAVVEQKNAELYALEAQIDPHFLYNTLDTINWKAIENEQYEISEMVGALADILRYTVYNMGEKTTIQQELSWLKEYILLQDAKKGRKIDVRIQVPDRLLGYKIYKLLLQPLVENAIRHGFTGEEEQDVLLIQIKESEDQLHIMIGNSGRHIPPEKLVELNDEKTELDGHMGVGNVRKRLKLYYGGQATLYFESEKDSFTKVHLFIPGKEEETCESQS